MAKNYKDKVTKKKIRSILLKTPHKPKANTKNQPNQNKTHHLLFALQTKQHNQSTTTLFVALK